MSVLVTGGAGYVGSHALLALRSAGIPCVVLDNLVRGRRELVLDAELVIGDISDRELVLRVIKERAVDAVMHFAAFAYVGESVSNPAVYYRNNVSGTLTLLECMCEAGIRQVVFSSTCATYGVPEATPIPEEHPQKPINPYGATKLAVERMLRDFEPAHGLRSVIFRYFNAAGADPSAAIGEWHEPETHLIPLALESALGERGPVDIYGTDYPTEDGTCIRDYIHVNDLARAHMLGLKHLQSGGGSDAFNLGNGRGFSVLQVLDAAERVTGRRVPRVGKPRRPGDPHTLVGSAVRAKALLGWEPEFADLDSMIETAWRWRLSRPHG